jgi:tripartite-type tricarboxylate transporter receptor subunit TctC
MQWHTRLRVLVVLCVVSVIGAFAAGAGAQENRPIRLILPFPPGGPADAMARIVAQRVGEGGGPSMVVDTVEKGLVIFGEQ